MRVPVLVAVLSIALVGAAFVAAPVSASESTDCETTDAGCQVHSSWCDLYERLPPIIPYACR